MSPKELTALVKVCHKYGIKRLKTAQVELDVELDTIPKPSQKEAPISQPSEPKPSIEYTPEDVLFWSASDLV